MRYVSYVSVLALVAAFVMFLSAPSTAEVKLAGGGSISGKVVDADGNPVADAMVKVVPAKEKGAGDKVKKNSASNLVDDGTKPEKEKGDKPNRPAPVAEGKTDATGAFKLEGIPAGNYTVMSMAKEKGMGHANVTVAEGQDASVEIKLAPRAEKAGKEKGDKPDHQEKYKKD